MVNFVIQLSINPNRVLVSVITFDSAAKDSFALWKVNTTQGVTNAIYALKYANSTDNSFNLARYYNNKQFLYLV